MDELLTLNFPANNLVLLPGTPNNDELFGSVQNEGLLGYGGNDLALGYGGDDWVFGNEGNDSLYGNEGADVLQGGKDNDFIFGGLDNDILSGDNGNDILLGEEGSDTLWGGGGHDRFVIGSGDADPANADLILDYSGGEDWLELTDGLTFADVEIVSGAGDDDSDTIVRNRATGESIAVLRGFDHSGGTEFGNDEMTLIRLHEIVPEMPEEPIEEPPVDPVMEAPEEVDEETPVVELEGDMSQTETDEREVTVDPGNTPEDAYPLEVGSNTLVYSDRVSSTDTEDYFVFSLGAANSLSLDLDIFTGNAQIELLDVNQNVIGSSQDPGSIGNSISAPLEAGTYYIRVEWSDVVTTDYSINLSVTPRTSGITTTGSEEEFELFTEESGPLINLTPSDDEDMEAFRSDPRFGNIDGSGYATVIIDSGIDTNHSFFGDRVVYSYDFADNDAVALDRNGHGTLVSSIVASEDTTYPGIAPGTDIIHLKVLSDDGTGTWGNVEQALQWVVENTDTYNIASVNLSLGAGNFNQAISPESVGISDEIEQIVAQDTIVVAAAGSNFYQYQTDPGIAYPGADPNVIAVGAVWDSRNGLEIWEDGAIDFSTDADRIVSFSQRHPELTDIFAPGAYITGASPGGGTTEQAGTSFATAHISGVAVLAQQLAQQELGRRLTSEEFRNLLQSTGVTINDGDDEDDNVVNTGADYKRVDVLGLAEAIVALNPPPAPEPEPSNLVRYDFTYYYDGFTTENDYYTGYVYGEAGELEVGTLYDVVQPDVNNETGFDGYYYITDATVTNDSGRVGEVFVNEYFDVDSSGESYTPFYFQNGYASGINGLGTEYDFITANGMFDDFGLDFAEADLDFVDTTESLFVGSLKNDRILQFNAETGNFIDVFVPTGSGGLDGPLGLTIGPDENLYVSSVVNHQVLRYDGETGNFIDVFVPTGSGGLDEPDYLAFGPDGNLYVSSRDNDRVLRYDGDTGSFIDTFASGGGLSVPDGLAFGPDGNLYVSSGLTNQILRYDGRSGNFMDVFASGGGLNYGDGITFGPDDHLYVSSLFSHEVLRYDGVTGEFIDEFVAAGSGGLNEPGDVTFGLDGNLYVSSGTDELLRYDGVTGEFIDSFASDDRLDRPVGLAFVN